MRILFVTPYFYPAQAFGGPVKVTLDAGKELVKRGHEVVVLTSDAKDLQSRLGIVRDEIQGMKIYYLRNLSMSLVKRSKLFITPELPKRIVYELKSSDVIHAHEYTTYQNIVVHKYAKKSNVPYVLQAHGSLPRIGRQARKWLFDVLFGYRILRCASKVIALTQVEAEQYRRMGVSKCKVAIIPNGIDLSEYADPPARGLFRNKFGIDQNAKIILYLGRLHKTKRIDFLINAYAHLIKSLKCNNLMLVIAGPDDGYLNEVKSLVNSSGTSDSVLFTGFINDKHKLEALMDADVFVTPSFHGFPVTFLEACAAGTPIITTTFGDTLEWINNKIGFVTQPTHQDIARAIHKITSDDDLEERFSRNCRKIAWTEFSLSKVVDRLEDLYEEVAMA